MKKQYQEILMSVVEYEEQNIYCDIISTSITEPKPEQDWGIGEWEV